MAPLVSQIINSLTPILINISEILIPAAPPPFTTIFKSEAYLFINFNEFKTAATVTIAVPC